MGSTMGSPHSKSKNKIWPRHLYQFLKLLHANAPKSRRDLSVRLLRAKLGEEVHLEGVCELRRRAEGEVHVMPQHLGDVRPRHLHATRQLRLRNAQLLHPPQDPPQKCRANPVNRFHVNAPRAAPCGHQTVHYSLLPIPCAANAPRPWGMQPNTSPFLNRIYLTSPLLELPPNILTYRLTDCKHKHRAKVIGRTWVLFDLLWNCENMELWKCGIMPRLGV